MNPVAQKGAMFCHRRYRLHGPFFSLVGSIREEIVLESGRGRDGGGSGSGDGGSGGDDVDEMKEWNVLFPHFCPTLTSNVPGALILVYLYGVICVVYVCPLIVSGLVSCVACRHTVPSGV